MNVDTFNKASGLYKDSRAITDIITAQCKGESIKIVSGDGKEWRLSEEYGKELALWLIDKRGEIDKEFSEL